MTDKQPGVKWSGPAGSRPMTVANTQRDSRSLFETLFGSRQEPDRGITMCGPIRKPREVER